MAFVTTSLSAQSEWIRAAEEAASTLGWDYVPRGNASLRSMIQKHGETYLIQGAEGPMLGYADETMHRFHLSMAHLRLLRLARGEGDRLVEAILACVGRPYQKAPLAHTMRQKGPLQGLRILDATLGLGGDAIVLAYAGADVVGIEGCLPLAYVTNWGLRYFQHEDARVTEALRTIQVVGISRQACARYCTEGAYDVVYIDPMFERPVMESPQFHPLRPHIIEESLTREDMQEALRISRYGVVLKERGDTSLFSTLGCTRVAGGRYSRIAYGIRRKEGETL